jgi:hypothetical protein
MANKLAVMADSPSDYERLGLSPTTIARWEDGKRTGDSAGTYEHALSRAKRLPDVGGTVIVVKPATTTGPQPLANRHPVGFLAGHRGPARVGRSQLDCGESGVHL